MLSLNDKICHSISHNCDFASIKFGNILSKYLNAYYDYLKNDLVILCIGTDRSTGDCLGPLVGHKLSYSVKKYDHVHIFGTLATPVHAKNLETSINTIHTLFKNPFIVAIDACLGDIERIGYINIGLGPLKPGTGVKKTLPEVGDIYITGVVNMGGFMEYVTLQNTRLYTVMKMADIISFGFLSSLRNLFKNYDIEKHNNKH